jgi:hypothetical protein
MMWEGRMESKMRRELGLAGMEDVEGSVDNGGRQHFDVWIFGAGRDLKVVGGPGGGVFKEMGPACHGRFGGIER